MGDCAKQEYAKIVGLEEMKWKQKTKIKWLQEGDNNTKFFHHIASSKRNTNYIYSLLDDRVKRWGRRRLIIILPLS